MNDNRVKIFPFANHRISEMITLTDTIKSQSGAKRVFQRLPISMRRRAMSHNIKRVPRILRDIHQRELEKQEKKKPSKRPSRKHRRRPNNLLEEYSRRKRNHVWLETHIWHAKRFHMKEQWGYKMADRSTEKGIRSSYRAVANHCFIQDISYYNCIELHGKEEILLNGLSRLTSQSVCRSFKSQHTIHGTHEGSVFIYKHDSFPFGAIAPVRFMWKCTGAGKSTNSSNEIRQLWIWSHPASFEALLAELQIVFKLDKRKRKLFEEEHNEGMIKKKKIKLDRESAEGNHSVVDSNVITQDSHLMTDLYDVVEYCNNDVKLLVLKDKLVRFRLSGAESSFVLNRVLQCASLKQNQQDDGAVDKIILKITKGKMDVALNSNWWISYYEKSDQYEKATKQQEYWHHIESPNFFSPNCIFGLTVRDPRGFLPPKKINPTLHSKDPQITNFELPQVSLSDAVSHSPLWNENLRNRISTEKMSESLLNQLKSEMNLVPGSVLELQDKEARIPLILIQNSGGRSQRLGYGCGWDIILPSGWGMPFWVSFIYNGARAGGMQDAKQIALEQGNLFFPDDYPDTEMAQQIDEMEKKEKMKTYFRKPPAKRPNYLPLGIVAPFHFPWQSLLCEWSDEESQRKKFGEKQFGVLRERRCLKILQEMCLPWKTCSIRKSEYDQLIIEKSNDPYLVPIHLQLIHRGVMDRNDIICLPSLEDLENFVKDQHFGGPTEPKHNLIEAQKNNKERKQLVAKLRKRRKKLHQKLKALAETEEKSDGTTTILKAEIEKLHLEPEFFPEVTIVRKSCSREIFGFISNGGFSLSIGKENGIGFCTLSGLLMLLEMKQKDSRAIVLVRSTTSLQYRLAYMSVIHE